MSYRPSTKRATFTASWLAACVVYQLGACPCGCLEHNYWLQSFGLASGEHPHGYGASDVVSVGEHNHDCDSEPEQTYLHHTSAVERVALLQRHLSAPNDRPIQLAAAALMRPCLDRGPPGRSAGPSLRATLQVFLL